MPLDMIRTMKTNLALKYNGPAVDDGMMDVYMAASNMIAFSEFVVLATKATFGENATAKAEVAGFGKGSFITDIVFSFSGQAASIFTMLPADHLLDVIKGAFELWKHLKGQPATAIQYGSQTAMVTNNNGQILHVQTQSLTLVLNEKAVGSVDRFVRQSLAEPGMDSISLATHGEKLVSATREEAQFFVPVSPSKTITDIVIQMGLVIESPSFKDGNMWKVFDGTQTVHVHMQDQEFLDRINGGARFGKGDVLLAEVRLVQKQVGMKLEAERSVIKVLEHKQGPQQYSLP
jgi:hypothetical protein